MTDEEKLAEEYVKSVIDVNAFDWKIVREIGLAYIAGLKAGRPKWHKVADGDLPNGYKVVLNQAGMATQYDPNRGFLGFGGAGIIAWCEIPLYKKE